MDGTSPASGIGGRVARVLAGRRNRGDLALGSPVSGRVVPLSDVPDKVFSSGALGDGVGVQPDEGGAVAPIGGTVQAAMPHAYGISAGDVEVLVHIGVDTVELGGRHFTQLVTPGTVVERGAQLADFDIEGIRSAGFDPVVMVIVTRRPPRGTALVVADAGARIAAGDDILEITAK